MGEKVTFLLDDKPVQAPEGEKVLWAALDSGVHIPHLCAERERREPFGACRLCFVEVEGRDLPVLSCSEPVVAEMRVHTRSERVDRLRRTAFELLMSHHDLDCKNCARNGTCSLQHLAKTLRVPLKPKRFRKLPTEMPIDESHPDIVLNPNRCILCGKCVWVCNQADGSGVLDFVFRGLRTRVAPFLLEPLAESVCKECLRCADVCPVGALTRKG
jgi:bidirectional [NiFe] hydrogenase diaphorase subunit